MNGQLTLITSVIEGGVRAGASSDQIAELAAVAYRGMGAALAPIIGRRSVAALFERSLHLTAQTHRWIIGAADGKPSAVGAEALESTLARQTSVNAADGGLFVLNTFNDLLTNLIGSSLTERLLLSSS